MTDTPKREPLLSDDAITQWSSINMTGVAQRKAQPPHTNTSYSHGAKHARDHYENLIDAGVLMVVKEVKMYSDGDMGEDAQTCPECDYQYYYSDKLKIGEFCRCGSKIIE